MKLFRVVKALLLFVIAAGAAYQVLALIMVALFTKRQDVPIEREDWPPVSILKPLCGMDEQLRENLESFCVQDYPRYEVLMGFSDQNDAALPVARDVAGSFPHVAKVVIKEGVPATNRKVANLIGLEQESRFELSALSDSDMKVDPDYLKTIVSEYLEDGKTGLVTCPYMVWHPASLGAALESLTIASDLFPAVLVARRLEGITFGLGASLLVSKNMLRETGGLSEIRDYLADDYQIGNRIHKKGYRVVLSDYIMDAAIGPMASKDYLRHQLRWAVTYRASRPKGYLAYGITHVFPLTLVLCLLRGGYSFAFTSVALLLRAALAWLVLKKLGIWKRPYKGLLLLLPSKDALAFGIWLTSLFVRKVSWRGRFYQVRRNGKMKEIEKAAISPRFIPRDR
jgi:ceramide glucosyltransferase